MLVASRSHRLFLLRGWEEEQTPVVAPEASGLHGCTKLEHTCAPGRDQIMPLPFHTSGHRLKHVVNLSAPSPQGIFTHLRGARRRVSSPGCPTRAAPFGKSLNAWSQITLLHHRALPGPAKPRLGCVCLSPPRYAGRAQRPAQCPSHRWSVQRTFCRCSSRSTSCTPCTHRRAAEDTDVGHAIGDSGERV